MSINKQQEAVQQFWNGKPCDSENSQLSSDTRRYFEEIEAERYRHQNHILTILEKIKWQGKKVLEIGTGVGTDARRIISFGANYYGINVDEGSCKMTRQALALFGVQGVLESMSATALRFSDETFDVVYSFGVLHHIPDVDTAIAEINRVLKPGGILLFMVYNRSSINYQIEILYLRRWMLRFLQIPGVIASLSHLGFPRDKLTRHVELFNCLGKMSDEEWLSRNTDGPDSPFSRVYDQKDVQNLLDGKFQVKSEDIYYFEPRHWGLISKILPSSLVRYLGCRWGWHRVILAEKL